MSRRRKAAGGVALLGLLAGGVGWIERQRIATHLIDDRLAAAGVPARYRITAFGPFTQTIEDVRLGDPAHPDLTARRLELTWAYGLGLPALTIVRGDGIRLHGAWRDGRISFGTIDRLLPRSSGSGPKLPDLEVALRDARVAIDSPFGGAMAAIEGRGNLARDFRGKVTITAPRVASGGCTIGGLSGSLAVAVERGVPHVRGPVRIADAACPGTLALGAGTIGLDLATDPAFDRVGGRLAVTGFAGRSGTFSFGPLRGAVSGQADADGIGGDVALGAAGIAGAQGRADRATISGRYRLSPRQIDYAGRIGLVRMTAAPGLRRSAREAGRISEGTPVGPLAAKLSGRIAAMLAGADAAADVAFHSGDAGRTLRVSRATVMSAGATARLAGSFDQAGNGWRIAAHLDGTDLPAIDIRAARPTRTAPLTALVEMRPYRAGTASLALTPLRIVATGETIRFTTIATVSGALAGGSVTELAVPIAGQRDRNGAVRIGAGCNPLRFRQVRLAGMTLDPGGLTLCGAPILSLTPAGGLRLDARTSRIALAGRSGSAPLAIEADGLRLTEARFAATNVRVSLGAGDDPTRLTIGMLDGRMRPRLGGRFADAAGSIGRIPLALSGAGGDWRLERGALHLGGAVQVADRDATPRFLPLLSDDVALTLAGGRIEASATLHPPRRTDTIARIALHDDLASGTGGARIVVPGIAFAKRGLQPEMLTPLTLGVVANVIGTVSGAGRIEWSGAGVTSTGDFGSERLDLAAAFGPVTGLSGTLHFTDLLGLVTAPRQTIRIAAINPGVIVTDGVAHVRLLGQNRVAVEDARWPFAGGTLALDPSTLDFSQSAERRLTFRIAGLDAAAFIQQLDFPNIAATGTFDGKMPMIFDSSGGRIEGGDLTARGPGTLAYVGELSNAALGTMGKLAFDALKKIRYAGMDISLDGKLDGEIVSRVRFEGVRQATGERGLIARMIRNLPFRFNIRIQAPFRGLVGSARAYADPSLLLQQVRQPAPPPAVQPSASALVR